ncbi:MAG: hypothetical protein D6683_14775 [Actinomyces sp.]|nr:MAG: hypothetical protein D6683_14775 [Actinomyces sp.]
MVEADALADDEDDERRAAARRREAERLTDLVTFVETLDDTLTRLARARSWRELAETTIGLVDRWFGGETVRAAWPEHERRAADAVFAALDRLAALDVFDDTPSLAVFRRALETELADDLGRHGRFGRGVLVGPLSLAAGIPLDLAVVVGMAEGSLPARFRDDSLLPDRERRLVSPHLTTRAERTVSQHHDLLSVLAGARESVGLVPRGDLRRTTERAPSRWVLDAVEAVEGDRPGGDDLVRTSGDWVSEVPSFLAGIRRLTTPATVQEFDLHLLVLSAERGDDPGRHPLVAQRPELDAAVTSLRSRASRRFTRFDGNLAAGRPVTIPSPADPERAQAPTRLEAWAACPHAYFVRHLLGVDAVDEPAEEYRISPLTRGSLIHDVLHRWIDECLVAGTVPSPDEPWPAARVERLAELAAAACDEAAERGLTGRRIYWRRDRATIIADLVAFAAHDDAWRRERRARPHAVEWGFGLTGSTHDAVPLVLPDGRRVHLRGRVDRLDLADDGTIIVTDYKTGSKPGNYEPSPDDPTAGGTRLQLGLYALAARHLLGRPDAPVRAEYRFVDHRAEFATVGLDVDDAHVAEFLGVVAAIVDGIEAGLFPAHPAEPSPYSRSTCPFCDPDGLGTRERHRLYLAKAGDPALRPYLELADPDLIAALAGPDTDADADPSAGATP